MASAYEAEVLPELGTAHEFESEFEFESELESEQFFGALANLARRGVGWLTSAGSPQRRFAWRPKVCIIRNRPWEPISAG